MSFSRLTLLPAALLLWLPACGLFVGEPEPPTVEEVAIARLDEAPDWELLEQAWLTVAENPLAPLQSLAAIRLEHPRSVRLAVYEQDLQLQHLLPEQVQALAKATYAQSHTALNAFLYARVVPSTELRDALLIEALDLDADLVEARVMQLALAAFAGDTEVLKQLLELLNDHPGSASAWRLLATLAPLFDRRDLALRAAATEPWSPFDSMDRAIFDEARRALQGGSEELALLRSQDLPQGTSQTINLQVAAFAALEKPQVALDILDEYLAQHPDDIVAVFNRALLLREYLDRADEAALELERFLEMDAQQGGGDLMRRMQAELWLGRGPQS